MKTRVMICLIIIIAALCGVAGADEWPALYIGGEGFTPEQVKSDQKGTGWAWTAADKRLTLSGYNGGGISTWNIVGMTLEVTKGTDNTISGEFRMQQNIVIEGGGSLTAKRIDVRVLQVNDVAITSQFMTGSALHAKGALFTAMGPYGGVSFSNIDMTDCVFNSSGCAEPIHAWDRGRFENCDIVVTDSDYALHAGSFSFIGGSLTVKGIKKGITLEAKEGSMDGLTLSATDGKNGLIVERLQINNSDIDMTGSAKIQCENLKITDSSISLKGSPDSAIDAREIKLFGKNRLSLMADTYGIYTTYISMGKDDYIDIVSGARAIKSQYVNGDAVIKIDEADVSCTGNRLVISGGVIVSQQRVPYALNIAGRRVPDGELSKPLSGAGWSWDPKDCLITLNNYSSGPISIGGDEIKVRLIGENEARIKMHAKLDLSGDGKLTCKSGIISAFGLVMNEACVQSDSFYITGPALVTSGKLNAASRLAFDHLTLRGGEVVCTSMFEEFVVHGDCEISGGRASAREIIVKGNLNMTGGLIDSSDLTPHDDSDKDEVSVSVDKDVTFTGGEMKLYSKGVALTAKGKVAIGGTADGTIEGEQGGISAKKVTIGGERFTGNDSVKVVNGQLASSHSIVVALQFGDSVIYIDQDHTNAAGEGWKWNAKKKLITLSKEFSHRARANDLGVYIPGVTVKVEGEVGGQGSIGIDCSEYVTFKGPGTLHAYISAKKGMKLMGNLTARLGMLDVAWNPKKPTTIQNAIVYAKLIGGYGNAVIKNSRVFIDENINISGYLTITNSVLHARSTLMYYNDVQIRSKLTAKNSAILCTGLECKKKSISSTLVFEYGRVNDNSDDGYVLTKSVTMNRAMTLPDANYLVPKGVKLTARKKLTFPGKLYVKGKISGKIVSDNVVKDEPVKDIEPERVVVDEVEIV